MRRHPGVDRRTAALARPCEQGRANADKFEKAIGPYLEKAQRVGGRRSRPSSSSSSRSEVDTKAVRAWAASNGIELSNRGRVPADVIEKYKAAGN
jgi:hypothetical protein